MRRLFWVGVGAAGTVLALRRIDEALRRWSPAGVAERMDTAGERAGAAVSEAVRRFGVARAEREQELVASLLVTPEGGDPGAVLHRGRARDPWADTPGAAGATAVAGGRPPVRVDEDEPLHDV